MSRNLVEYVSFLCGSVRVDSRTRASINRELRTHLEDHAEDLKKDGRSEPDATRDAILSFGNPSVIARDLLMVHSRGTWKDAFLVSLPHLLMALLLTSYYQQSLACAVAVFVIASLGIAQTVTGKAPAWSFSWLGYCLVPAILAIFLLLGARHWWTVLGIAYIPCAVIVIVHVIRHTVTRDPLYLSLMLSPWAVITVWSIATHTFTDLHTAHLDSLRILLYGRELVGSFVALAISSFVFTRIAPRWGKAIALIVPLAVVFAGVSVRCWADMSLLAWFVSTVALVLVSAPTVREFLR